MEAVGPGHWRIAVKNNSPSPLRSEISIHTEGGRPPARRSLFLNPGTVTEFEYSLPPECGKAVLRLPTDAFPSDNELLLVRSAPAPVAVSMGIPEQSGKIFLNIIHSLPGFSPVPDGSDPDLLLLEGKTENAKAPGKAAIIFAASGKPSYGAVTAERHPLTDGLNWSGLLTPSIGSMKPGEKAGVLLWQGESPPGLGGRETPFPQLALGKIQCGPRSGAPAHDPQIYAIRTGESARNTLRQPSRRNSLIHARRRKTHSNHAGGRTP